MVSPPLTLRRLEQKKTYRNATVTLAVHLWIRM